MIGRLAAGLLAALGSVGGCAFGVSAASVPTTLWAQTLTLNLDDISGADWAARQVRVSLTANGAAQLSAGTFSALDREFKDVHIDCGRFAFDKQQIRCEAGRLRTGTNQDEAWPLELIYETRSRRLQFSFAPAAQERWAFTLANGEARLDLDQAEASRIAPLLKSELLPNAGRMSGVLRFAPARASADLNFTGIGFADSAGLHAGEKLAGRFVLEAARSAKVWNWSTVLDWHDGAVFWDPVFVASAGHRVEARGTLDEARVEVREALLDWRGLGRLTGAMVWDRAANRAVDFVIEGRALVLAALREFVPQVWAEQHHLADLRLAGAADLRVEGSAGRLRRAALSLRNAQADAPQRALAIDNLNADLRYELAGTAPVSLNLAALRIRGLTLGPIEVKGEMRDGSLTIPNLLVPVLGGVLALADIEAEPESVRLQGALTAVPMEQLSAALGWHPMGGDLSFVLPKVTYAKSTLTLDGALIFKLFGGDAHVDGIRLADPFGRTPRLTADLHLKRLNLEEITRAVKFGNITGYLDVDVDELVMENWQPQSMDAKVFTSEGDFKKRISQRAVQNISSIGGAGAGAAIQRSFLSFFETFGYAKIGISCKLRNSVCEMGGAGNTSGGYALIQGGGIPAVNVVGYNRFVGWQELLDRIKAVIDGNSKIIIE